MYPDFLPALLDSIRITAGIRLEAGSWQEVAGGDINRAARLHDAANRPWFLKLNTALRLDMFAAESEGLRELAAVPELRVPAPAGYGADGAHAWLLMEWLEFSGATASDAELGRALACMHRHTAGQFGWHRDNYIGSTAQPNAWSDNWPDFFARQRLGHQLALAVEKGVPGSIIEAGQTLLARLGEWFTDYQPRPSLLHGDLWSGNRAALAGGSAAVFDPAVYYGDRETDIAMTQLFGGFSEVFYSNYAAEWPLDKGAARRLELYNLYHILNHYNLFGGSYLAQAERVISKLLAG